jgi:hypothetical protein
MKSIVARLTMSSIPFLPFLRLFCWALHWIGGWNLHDCGSHHVEEHISSNAKTRIAKLLRNVVGLLTCHEVIGHYPVRASRRWGACEASSCIKQF